jgi:hypothetical protein
MPEKVPVVEVPAAREALGAFADKRLSTSLVVRALLQHQGWFVPEWFLAQHLFAGRPVLVDRLVTFATEFRQRTDQLWLFTDDAALEKARAAIDARLLGIVGGPIAGDLLFLALAPGPQSVEVNPGSPARDTWSIGAGAFELVRVWARAIELEGKLKAWSAAAAGSEDWKRALAQVLDRMVDYPSYLVLVERQDNALVRLPAAGGPCAMIFTAPDNAEAFLAYSDPALAAQWHTVSVDASLFKQLPQAGLAAFSLNSVHGPGPSLTVSIELCQLLEQAAHKPGAQG